MFQSFTGVTKYGLTCKRRWTQNVPQKVHGQTYLERTGPEKIQVESQIHELLGINLHQVGCLSD